MFFFQCDWRGSYSACSSCGRFISNKAFNCPPSWLFHGHGQQQQSRLPSALPSIPSQLMILLLGCPDQTRQRAARPGWQLFPLLPPCPPPIHPSILSTLPLLCAQPRDLICLVISGLACSAQLHSKVKLDKGIGASPCKTTSPWQLREWAADCSREWRRREERRRWRGMKDVPERKADTNSLLSFPRGSFVSGREPAMKTGAV